MISTSLQRVMELVVHRAQRQGVITPCEVREELTQAGLPESLWKDVVALARPALSYRGGRYHYRAPVSARVREEQAQQRGIQRAVRHLIRQYRTTSRTVERREEDRFHFVQAVKVTTQDGRELTLLSRDLSATGIRLVGTHGLLGQKIRVTIPAPDNSRSWDFLVRILWTSPVGEDLVENGGTFLQLGAGDGPRSRFVGGPCLECGRCKGKGVKLLYSTGLGEAAQQEHGFGTGLVPEDAGTLQAKVNDSADGALDGS